MKNFILFTFCFLILSLSLKAQTKPLKLHYAEMKGLNLPQGDLLLYQIKDSTIVTAPYSELNLFARKTKKELSTIYTMIETGEIDLTLQEYSTNWIDKIIITRRKQRLKNTLIGIAVGTAAGLIYFNVKEPPNPEYDRFDWTRAFFPPMMVGVGAIVGASLPVAKARFKINRKRKSFQQQKAELNKYAIMYGI